MLDMTGLGKGKNTGPVCAGGLLQRHDEVRYAQSTVQKLFAVQEELGTPALAFVRAVCDALRLDSAVEEEVLELRHNLLRLTHTREFAQAAQFKVLPSP